MSKSVRQVELELSEVKMTDSELKRFFAKTVKNELTGCIEWTHNLSHNGYGKFWLRDKNHFAHRIAYIVHHGSIPDGLSVLHGCPCGDNAKCVNVDHLSLGTHDDNMRHMAERGRAASGLKNGKYTRPDKVPRGSKVGTSILNENQVAEIKMILSLKSHSVKEISLIYKVCVSLIYYIRSGKLWKHVPFPEAINATTPPA